NDFADLPKDEARKAIEKAIQAKAGRSQMGKMESEGTTPRQLTDLLGSLSDLVSGSGDKGTPIVLIQGYFDNYAS
ncbi:MAG: coenzyme F420-0:L-glutamate ligase, partial [Treponema sp.]|nr:coenzyme F420-0:L-glutamate ligase [Treponema sp.]